MDTESKSNLIVAVISALIIGALGGWFVAQAASPKAGATMAGKINGAGDSQPVSQAFDTKSTNLRVQLNTLLHEHAAMGAVALTALYEGVDTSRLMQQLQENQNELANLIQQQYGNKAKDTFTKLWTQHMDEYQNYTLGRKNNDTNKMNTAKQNLQTVANKLGDLFANSGRNLSASTVSGLMMEHINGTLAVVDAVAQKNTTKTADAMKVGYDQAGRFADTLAQGMILDNPNLYTK